MLVFPACMANPVPLEYQAATDEMAVREPKVTKVSQERLDPRGLRGLAETLVLMERMALKGNAEPRTPRTKRGTRGEWIKRNPWESRSDGF